MAYTLAAALAATAAISSTTSCRTESVSSESGPWYIQLCVLKPKHVFHVQGENYACKSVRMSTIGFESIKGMSCTNINPADANSKRMFRETTPSGQLGCYFDCESTRTTETTTSTSSTTRTTTSTRSSTSVRHGTSHSTSTTQKNGVAGNKNATSSVAKKNSIWSKTRMMATISTTSTSTTRRSLLIKEDNTKNASNVFERVEQTDGWMPTAESTFTSSTEPLETASQTTIIIVVVFTLLFTVTVGGMSYCIYETRKENERVDEMAREDAARVIENHQYEIPRREMSSNFVVNTIVSQVNEEGDDVSFESPLYDNSIDDINSLC